MADTIWVHTGTSTSGDGYAAALVTNIANGIDAPEFGVRLIIQNVTFVQPTDSRAAAIDLMQRFCHAMACFRSFERRERLLAQGYAVLG